jgi:hypothetical protein
MARQRYDIKESLNRFLRLWQGNPIVSDEPGSVTGEILSEDEAWSDIAELFAGSLPNQTLTLPTSVADAVSADQAHEFGEIYTSTGTVTDVIGTSAVKITGAYQNNGLSSDNITPDQANDRVTINSTGTYFVAFQVAFSGSASTTYTIELYLDSVAQPQTRTLRRLNASGDVGSCSGLGLITVTGTGMDLELYASAGASSRNFLLEAGQIYVEKTPV